MSDICPSCDGSGWWSQFVKPCEECGGTGRMSDTKANKVEQQHACKVCGSNMLLPVTRITGDFFHCNKCGSEMPKHLFETKEENAASKFSSSFDPSGSNDCPELRTFAQQCAKDGFLAGAKWERERK